MVLPTHELGSLEEGSRWPENASLLVVQRVNRAQLALALSDSRSAAAAPKKLKEIHTGRSHSAAFWTWTTADVKRVGEDKAFQVVVYTSRNCAESLSIWLPSRTYIFQPLSIP